MKKLLSLITCVALASGFVFAEDTPPSIEEDELLIFKPPIDGEEPILVKDSMVPGQQYTKLIQLYKGWNLISVPGYLDFKLKNIFEDGSLVVSIFGFNVEDNKWDTWKPNEDDRKNDFNALSSEVGYWVNAKRAFSIKFETKVFKTEQQAELQETTFKEDNPPPVPIEENKVTMAQIAGTFIAMDPTRDISEYVSYEIFESDGTCSVNEWINGEDTGIYGCTWTFDPSTLEIDQKMNDTIAEFAGKISGDTNEFHLSGNWSDGTKGELDYFRSSNAQRHLRSLINKK